MEIIIYFAIGIIFAIIFLYVIGRKEFIGLIADSGIFLTIALIIIFIASFSFVWPLVGIYLIGSIIDDYSKEWAKKQIEKKAME